MPKKPLHPCGHRGCAALAADRYCAEHARQARAEGEARRGTATERGYDGSWAKVRVAKLAADPICERCRDRMARIEPAVLVHHRDGNPRNNAWANLESLCDGCHDAEHAKRGVSGR